ncbi:MAG: M20 family metallopeptidase, partial [Nitrospinota bacterium]
MIGAGALRSRLEAQRARMVETLAQAVGIDSPTFPGQGAGAVASLFAGRYRALGAEVERLPGAEGTGDHMLARFRGARPGGPKVILLGHCDTVFPEGEAARRPFTVQGERARGPGVADMKGSLVACLFALEALAREGFRPAGEVLVLYDTDEERGNPSSRPHIERLGRDAAAALVIEPARADGSVVSSRKGSVYSKLSVQGVEAHAGVDPERGRSAVVELAHQILRACALERPGGTVNVTGLAGGERPAIVAGEASCFVELRADTQATLEEMERELLALAGRPALEGTKLAFERRGGRLAMERNAKTGWLIGLAAEVAREAGFTLTHTPTGGGSDGNFLSPLGVPVLDGLGPVGGNLHTEAEYLEVPTLAQRAALIAGLVE